MFKGRTKKLVKEQKEVCILCNNAEVKVKIDTEDIFNVMQQMICKDCQVIVDFCDNPAKLKRLYGYYEANELMADIKSIAVSRGN